MTLFWIHFTTALRQLLKNKARSALTMLGIIIGIGSVIFIMTAGEIAKNFLIVQISQFGTNVIEIAPNSIFGVSASGEETKLNDDIRIAIENSTLLPEVSTISAGYMVSKILSYSGEEQQVTIYGDGPEMFSVNNLNSLRGRLITTADRQNSARVVVIGEGLEEDLFKGKSAVGERIRMGGSVYTVIGVVKDFTQIGGFGPDVIFVPLTTVRQNFVSGKEQNTLSYLMVQFEQGTNVASFEERLKYVIRQEIDYPEDKEIPYMIVSREQFLGIFDQILIGIQAFVSAVAAISLIVGGIGIMNIMLVTVKERTKEIGLRKAIGAKNSSILAQFLIESVVLTTVGGIIGTAFGLGLSLAAVIGINSVYPDWGVGFVFVPNALILAVGVAVTVGIIFGLYPALKASRLHPIEALRYE